eukprot:TRINITY_DN46478_c0_g1_i1.p1 TRINITY_DN46478_c0_g1~~TRINITY_DN46478_c0_g1_i1.p1  ORF type:complete len:728 (-),score=118.92 TRINITY_DN46478_c0_g1_i1:190-2373(-)
MALRPKKYSNDHPFSLLTLIQSPPKPPKPPCLVKTPEKSCEKSDQRPTFLHPDTNGSLAAQQDIYRVSNYQNQPADLSLNSEPQHFLPPNHEPPHIFYPNLSLPSRIPPPLAHHQPVFENFYPNQQDDMQANNYNSDSLPPPLSSDHFSENYQDYYSRMYSFDETHINVNPRPEDRLYDYPPPNTIKQDLSENYRYEHANYNPIILQNNNSMLPPPLQPSPAVLLHIKYVMESVCESMCFTDITIVACNDTLRAHRSILSAHSTFLSFLLSTMSNSDLQEEPVLFFPNYSSLYVRMLLQFFYTGEVTTMTQKDIEPLREICYSLGISSLMTRLDDVKLSISFQNIPSYDSHIPPVDQADSKPSDPIHVDFGKPSEFKSNSDIHLTTSCKFQEPKEKQKLVPKDGSDEFQSRQYTVVSKMPKDTNLQVSMKCSKCDLKFFKKDILEEHLKVHEGIKPKECTICKKTFNSNYHLNTHIRTHTGQKPYSCAFQGCGKEFSDSSALRRHQVIHTGQKPYKCSICGKSFTDKSSGKRHEDTHSNRDLFPCSVCNKKFTRKSQLKKHNINIHSKLDQDVEELENKPEEKPEVSNKINECMECKAVFKKPSKLKQHMRVHSGIKPFECDQCDKSFARKTNLQLHKRTHTGEKPHACARCGRCFSDVSAFRRHCRTHSGERPYSCDMCGNNFTQASTLYNHKKTCSRRRRISIAEDETLTTQINMSIPDTSALKA